MHFIIFSIDTRKSASCLSRLLCFFEAWSSSVFPLMAGVGRPQDTLPILESFDTRPCTGRWLKSTPSTAEPDNRHFSVWQPCPSGEISEGDTKYTKILPTLLFCTWWQWSHLQVIFVRVGGEVGSHYTCKTIMENIEIIFQTSNIWSLKLTWSLHCWILDLRSTYKMNYKKLNRSFFKIE